MNDIDKILKAALSPKDYPSENLNNRIINQWKESGETKMKNKKLMIASAFAICALIIPTSAFAAYRYLMPKEIAEVLQDEQLGEAFDKSDKEEVQTVTDGDYKVTYLGQVTGESISERTGSAWELHPERTYIAVACERTDGIEMTYEDTLFISPLIQGLKPWNYNIASMNGGYSQQTIDGVLYRIIECDNIEIFADKELYLAVSNTTFFTKDAFYYDEGTGCISENDDYTGTNILFNLGLDPAKADPEKAEAYLKQLEEEWNSGSVSEKVDQATQNNTEDASDGESITEFQQEVFTDEENNLTFHIKDVDSGARWAGEERSETVLSYYLNVEGDGIDTLTYTLNKGEFCYYSMSEPEERKLYGKKYSVAYDEQQDTNYSILFSAKFTDYGYENDYVNGLGYTDLDAREKIYYDVLCEEVEATTMDLEIKMKDGRTIHKTLTFQNVLRDQENGFFIGISVK